jgi:hypothetical protein
LAKKKNNNKNLILFSLVIAVIIVILFIGFSYSEGFFNQSDFGAVNSCYSPASSGIVCNVFMYSNGTLNTKLSHYGELPIYLSSLGCNSVGNLTNMTKFPYQINVSSGVNITTKCYNNGTLFNPQTKSFAYKGILIINYTNSLNESGHTIFMRIIVYKNIK